MLVNVRRSVYVTPSQVPASVHVFDRSVRVRLLSVNPPSVPAVSTAPNFVTVVPLVVMPVFADEKIVPKFIVIVFGSAGIAANSTEATASVPRFINRLNFIQILSVPPPPADKIPAWLALNL